MTTAEFQYLIAGLPHWHQQGALLPFSKLKKMWVKMNSSNRSLTGRKNASKTPISIAVMCMPIGCWHYTFCCSLRENTHSFASNGDQQGEDTFIRAKKRTFAHKSDSITIFAFQSTFNNTFGHSFPSFDIQKRKIYFH